jgi:hypothetical protein
MPFPKKSGRFRLAILSLQETLQRLATVGTCLVHGQSSRRNASLSSGCALTGALLRRCPEAMQLAHITSPDILPEAVMAALARVLEDRSDPVKALVTLNQSIHRALPALILQMRDASKERSARAQRLLSALLCVQVEVLALLRPRLWSWQGSEHNTSLPSDPLCPSVGLMLQLASLLDDPLEEALPKSVAGHVLRFCKVRTHAEPTPSWSRMLDISCATGSSG